MLVLGMHRSGTSAVSRCLRVFGANHGERLMDNLASNPTGHWEDMDVQALNIRLLKFIGKRWDSVGLLNENDIDLLERNGFAELGVKLLESKITENVFFALKEPRMTILLPFWQNVFQRMGLQPHMVIVYRNPASVAASLHRRNGLPNTYGYLLWAAYTLECFHFAKAATHFLLDYDDFLNRPECILRCMSEFFQLPVLADELDAVVDSFLDKKLRHTIFDAQYLLESKDCPRLVAMMYRDIQSIYAAGMCDDAAFAKFYHKYKSAISM